jgi:hypothetical protein
LTSIQVLLITQAVARSVGGISSLNICAASGAANVRKEGEEQLPAIIQGKAIYSFLDKDLIEKSRPIKFRTPHGVIASGYRAEILPEVCELSK